MKNARLLAEQNPIIENQKRRIERDARTNQTGFDNAIAWRDQFNKLDRRLIDARSLADLGRWVANLLDVTADEVKVRLGSDLTKVEGLRSQAAGYRAAAEALAPLANGPSWEDVAALDDVDRYTYGW